MVSMLDKLQAKTSSTKKHLSKFKSFFENIKGEPPKKVNSSLTTGIELMDPHETQYFSNEKIIQAMQPEEHLIVKNNFSSLLNTNRKDEHTSIVEEQLLGRRRKETMNKIECFFKEKIVLAFHSFTKRNNVSDLDIKLYAEACKNYKVKQQIENLKETVSEIKQIKHHLLNKVGRFNSEFDPLELEYMELQSTEIDSLKALLQKKRLERRGQVNTLIELIYELQYMKEKIEELKEHDNLLRAQKEEEDKKSREQILRERRKILRENEKQDKETELYKWQLDQIEKQRVRPKEYERPILHYSKINPWTVKNDLLRDQSEQILSWQLRFNFLQRERPSTFIDEIQNGEVLLSDLRPWELRYAQEYEKRYYDMQLEIEQIMQQQREEKLQLERDTVKYVKAFWNTERKKMVRKIKESGVAQQLVTFNKKVGIHITNLLS